MEVKVKATGEVIDVAPLEYNGKIVSYKREILQTVRVYRPEEVDMLPEPHILAGK